MCGVLKRRIFINILLDAFLCSNQIIICKVTEHSLCKVVFGSHFYYCFLAVRKANLLVDLFTYIYILKALKLIDVIKKYLTFTASLNIYSCDLGASQFLLMILKSATLSQHPIICLSQFVTRLLYSSKI